MRDVDPQRRCRDGAIDDQGARRHRWHYYSRMDLDDVLVFKQYDTRVSGLARFTPHAAFDLPDTPPDAPLRRSIEVRCLVAYRSPR